MLLAAQSYSEIYLKKAHRLSVDLNVLDWFVLNEFYHGRREVLQNLTGEKMF
jgi:hypothetical protein